MKSTKLLAGVLCTVCCVLALSGCSNAAKSSTPSSPYRVLTATSGGDATLTLLTYDTSSFTGTYTLWIKDPGGRLSSPYNESGSFKITKKTSNGWTFGFVPSSGQYNNDATIDEFKVLTRYVGGTAYTFNFSDIPLPS